MFSENLVIPRFQYQLSRGGRDWYLAEIAGAPSGHSRRRFGPRPAPTSPVGAGIPCDGYCLLRLQRCGGDPIAWLDESGSREKLAGIPLRKSLRAGPEQD